MNRRSILISSAITALGLVMSANVAMAQTKSLKDQLVGAWTLVSADAIEPNGSSMPLVKGADVKGLLIFTDTGKVSYQVIGSHAKVASNDRMKMTPDEMKSSAESVLSYFGSYTVNEADKSYTVQIERSSFQNQTETPGKRMVALAGDELLKITNPGRLAGGQTINIWKRAK